MGLGGVLTCVDLALPLPRTALYALSRVLKVSAPSCRPVWGDAAVPADHVAFQIKFNGACKYPAVMGASLKLASLSPQRLLSKWSHNDFPSGRGHVFCLHTHGPHPGLAAEFDTT